MNGRQMRIQTSAVQYRETNARKQRNRISSWMEVQTDARCPNSKREFNAKDNVDFT